MSRESIPPATPGPEAALQQSEERFRLLVDAVTEYAIIMLDPAGQVASWNRGAEQLTGHRAEEALGHPLSIFYSPEDVAAGAPGTALATAAREGRHQGEGWRVRKDGSRFWASALVAAIRDGDGRLTGYAKVTRDLTEQRRSDDALHATEERLAATLDSIGDAVLATDEQGRITR